MRVLLAGATGVIGRAMLPLLVREGHQVTALVRDAHGERFVAAQGAQAVTGDALDRDGLHAALRQARPEVVVHQLTGLRSPDPADPFAVTDRLRTEGTANLLSAAVATGVRRVVAQSVAFAYEPQGGLLKTEDAPLLSSAPAAFQRTFDAAADLERQVSAAPLEGVVLRYGLLYGPGTWYAPDGQIGQAVLAGSMPVIGDGTGLYSFLHAHDAATAAVAAVGTGPAGVFNVVDDEPVPGAQWLPAYAQALDAPAPARVDPKDALAEAGWFAVYQMTQQRGASNAFAKAALGWQPTFATWRDGLLADSSGRG